MEQDESFFDFAAEVGFTKHMGGIGATDEIAELCQIGEGTSEVQKIVIARELMKMFKDT